MITFVRVMVEFVITAIYLSICSVYDAVRQSVSQKILDSDWQKRQGWRKQTVYMIKGFSMQQVSFWRLDKGTTHDYAFLNELWDAFVATLPDRIPDALKELRHYFG